MELKMVGVPENADFIDSKLIDSIWEQEGKLELVSGAENIDYVVKTAHDES